MNKNILDYDLGFIVGFLEGEGHIGIGRSKHYYNIGISYSYHPNIKMSNSVRNVLTRIQGKLGIGVVTLTSIGNEKEKEGYEFRLRNYEMVEFIELVLPYLEIKKYQALIMLNWYCIVKNCGLKKGMRVYDERISDKEDNTRSILFENIALLNKRGPLTFDELEEVEDIKYHYDEWFKRNYQITSDDNGRRKINPLSPLIPVSLNPIERRLP